MGNWEKRKIDETGHTIGGWIGEGENGCKGWWMNRGLKKAIKVKCILIPNPRQNTNILSSAFLFHEQFPIWMLRKLFWEGIVCKRIIVLVKPYPSSYSSLFFASAFSSSWECICMGRSVRPGVNVGLLGQYGALTQVTAPHCQEKSSAVEWSQLMFQWNMEQ